MNASNARVVLVTGASSGFGRAIADALVKDGYIVYGTFRCLPTDPRPFRVLALDVTSDDSVARAIGDVIRECGKIDAVINNAGNGLAGAIEDTSTEEAKAQLRQIFRYTSCLSCCTSPHA
jgi:NAD(P)-dependent dehydrogenase (short-subunit alcohol dehydrogenase family)